jgi:predicted dehydrogenase
MILTPEERALGKENFFAAIGSKPIRRDLLLKSIRSEVRSGKGLGPLYFHYGDSVLEPVRVGILGTGDEGSVLIGALNPKFMQVQAIADIRPYNVWRAFNGDYYSDTARKVRPGLMKVYGWKTEEEARGKVKVYGAYEELLKNAKDDGLEAVIIALPLHLHAPAAIAAMKAGLHVITEKLMAHSVHECKEMARVAKETNLLLAVGHQRHYNILYDNAVAMLRLGLLGELHYIRAQWHRTNLPAKDSWRQALPREAKPGDDMADDMEKRLADYKDTLAAKEKDRADKEKDLADKEKSKDKEYLAADIEPLKNQIESLKKQIELLKKQIEQVRQQMKDVIDAKKYGYEDLQFKDFKGNVLYDRPAIEELIRWRLFDRTSAGMMAELGSHQLDAASLFIAAVYGDSKKHPHPLNVSASSSRVLFDKEHRVPDRDVEDHVFCIFKYPAPDYDPQDPEKAKKKIGVQYSSINGNGFGGYGETVFGTSGTMIIEEEKESLLFKGSDTDKKIRVAQPKEDKQGEKKPPVLQEAKDEGDEESIGIGMLGALPAERGYAEELEHFAWCIRNRSPENLPRCHAEVALGDAVVALTANRAAREGSRIEFKEGWFQIDSDETPEDVTPDLAKYGPVVEAAEKNAEKDVAEKTEAVKKDAAKEEAKKPN